MSDLQIGWNSNLDIPSALARLPLQQLQRFRVLVTMIDSTSKVASLPSLVPRLRELDAAFVEIDDDVLLDAPTVLTLIGEGRFFTGFDEIWLFAEDPPVGKPTSIRLTSDQRIAGPSEVLKEWMQRVACTAGLGDGDGLNFATFDPTLANLWA